MAAYFAGDIKSQLEKRRPADDPYRGWLAAIKAYRQILKKQPDMVIQEMEDLIAKEQRAPSKPRRRNYSRSRTKRRMAAIRRTWSGEAQPQTKIEA